MAKFSTKLSANGAKQEHGGMTVTAPRKATDLGAALRKLWKAAGRVQRKDFLLWTETRGAKDLPSGISGDIRALTSKLRCLLRKCPSERNTAAIELGFPVPDAQDGTIRDSSSDVPKQSVPQNNAKGLQLCFAFFDSTSLPVPMTQG